MKRTLIILGIFCIFFSGCDLPGQYEGKDAKEWAEMYQDKSNENEDLQNQISDSKEENETLNNQIDKIKEKIDDVNTEIEDTNSEIEDAQYSEGDSSDMEYAIDNLEEIDTIDYYNI